MKTLNQYLDAYGVSHRNPTNRLIHFVCVPLIFFATLGLLWCLPLGAWFGLEGAIADWVNGATVLAAVSALFYLQLSFSAALIMGGWLTVSIGGILLIAASPLPLLWTSAAIWVAAWAALRWSGAGRTGGRTPCPGGGAADLPGRGGAEDKGRNGPGRHPQPPRR